MSENLTDPTITVDKSLWGDGPWMNEPDRVEFEHSGLPCMLIRNHFGVWCGYAAVAEGHPLFEANYHDSDAEHLDVHGGLTYSNKCSGNICHVPKPGQPDNVWWFGFDCNHYQDLSPRMAADNRRRFEETGDPIWTVLGYEVYRNLAYATSEVKRLAEQLSALHSTLTP